MGNATMSIDEKNLFYKISFTNRIIELSDFLKMSENGELVNHSSEVAQIARIILKNLDKGYIKTDSHAKKALNYMDLDTLADLYELHDLGKIFIPDEILNKPGRLTEQEFKYVYNHPEKTKKVLDYIFVGKQTKSMQILYDTIMVISMEHHENYDGTGYPRHLKGEEISLLGRIARVSDVISALLGHRCYNREFNSFEAIANYLVENKGILFDPKIVDVVINNQNKDERYKIDKRKILDIFDIRNDIETLTSKIKVKTR